MSKLPAPFAEARPRAGLDSALGVVADALSLAALALLFACVGAYLAWSVGL